MGAGSIRLWTDGASAVDDAIDAIGHVPLPPYIKRADRDADRERYQTSSRARAARLPRRPPACTSPNPSRRCAHAASSWRRSRCTSATARFNRSGSIASRNTGSSRSGTRSAPRRRQAINARARRGPAHHRRRHDDDADARSRGAPPRRPARRRRAGRPICSSIPGFTFQVIGGLVTNFHLPRSSLLMLVCGVRRPRPRARGVCEAVAARLPVLQLRRRDADLCEAWPHDFPYEDFDLTAIALIRWRRGQQGEGARTSRSRASRARRSQAFLDSLPNMLGGGRFQGGRRGDRRGAAPGWRHPVGPRRARHQDRARPGDLST